MTMDARYVHQRDVKTILDDIRSKLNDFSNQNDLNFAQERSKIEQLYDCISEADKYLRLKTTALLRHRLNQSKQLNKDQIDSEYLKKMKKPLDKPVVIPDLRDDSLYKSDEQPVTFCNKTPYNEKVSIMPLKYAKQSITKPVIRASSIVRRPATVVQYRLPRADLNDPTAPSPKLSKNEIERNGYLRLTQSGLLRESDIQDKFKDIITIRPSNGEIPNITTLRQRESIYKLDFTNNLPKQSVIKNDGSRVSEKGSSKSNEPSNPSLTLVNGEPLTKHGDFINFKRAYSTIWESFDIVLSIIRHYCEIHSISQVKVDIKALVDLCKIDPDEIKDKMIEGAFIDYNTSITKKSKFGFGFTGPNAEHKAAICIQSVWRGYVSRRLIQNLQKDNEAARIIQKTWRVYIVRSKFRKQLRSEWKRKVQLYDAHQREPSLYDPSKPHLMVHLVENATGCSIGRIRYVANQNTTVILFFKHSVPIIMQNYYRSFLRECSDRVNFHFPQLHKLPKSMDVAQMLCCDTRAIEKIRSVGVKLPVIILPDVTNDSVIDLSIKLNAIIIGPSQLRVSMFDTRDAVRRTFEQSGCNIFLGGQECFDINNLCKSITDLAVTNLEVQQWLVRGNNREIGWMHTYDFSLLENLRHHKDVLTESDVENRHFRELLTQNLINDISKIVVSAGIQNPNTFLRDTCITGSYVEEAPLMPVSSPEVALLIPPLSQPQIVGTWERLFISAYEPFASIHPSFTVSGDLLKQTVHNVAKELASKRVVGYNVATFFYSTSPKHKDEQVGLRLIADDLKIQCFSETLPSHVAKVVLNSDFDEERMDFNGNGYVYVQEKLITPDKIDLDLIKEKFQEYGIPIENRVFIFPHLSNNKELSLVIKEDTVEKLITTVYRSILCLVDEVFKIPQCSIAPLSAYLNAITFLKRQYDDCKELRTTLLMKKIHYDPSSKIKASKLKSLSSLEKESTQVFEDSFGEKLHEKENSEQ